MRRVEEADLDAIADDLLNGSGSRPHAERFPNALLDDNLSLLAYNVRRVTLPPQV